MTDPLPLLVFSDLDGTLLDHESYDWRPATPALTALRAAGGGLVLASSKTAAEIAPLRAELGFADWPAIVENGAGVLDPGAEPEGDDGAWRDIRARLAALPEALRAPFRGFGDMRPEDISAVTGLPRSSAVLAQRRRFSEPGLWQGDEPMREAFLKALAPAGIEGRQGGRFLTLSHGATKADRMREIAARYAPRYCVALGDAPNDRELLEAADLGIVVRNPAAPPLPPLAGEAAGRILRTRLTGPEGWNRAILDLLSGINPN